MIYFKEFSKAAVKDIKQTNSYLKNILKNKSAAHNLINETEATVGNLIVFPNSHPIVQDSVLAFYKIRYVQIKNYLMIYTVNEDTKTVYIVRFLYSHSNWKRILKHYVQYDEYLTETTGGYVHEEIEEYGKQFKKKRNNMPKDQDINIDNANFDEEKARQELYDEIKKGLDDIKAGRVYSEEEFFAILDEELKRKTNKG